MQALLRSGSVAKATLYKDDIESLVSHPIRDSDLLEFIIGVGTVDAIRPNRVFFLENYSDERKAQLDHQDAAKSLFILSPDFENTVNVPRILSSNVRLVFSKIVEKLYRYKGDYWTGAQGEAPRIHESSVVMPGVYISEGCSIGAGCLILPGVVIGPNCKIGDNVLIKSNSVIGQPGFGVFRDPASLNMHLPHVGSVIIGDNVEIGALNTVCSGTINPTYVGDFVKTDDHVHIAHNCRIGSGSQIAAHAVIAGSVTIGDNVWIGPNSSIINGISIGDNAFIGIGANVFRDVEGSCKVVGSPARKLL
jgi:UDP-3-O-[3-hydroxymyristoyl] glucosamine N-acyltransferase